MGVLYSVSPLHPHCQHAQLQVTKLRADGEEHLLNAATLGNVQVNVFLRKIGKYPSTLANFSAMKMPKHQKRLTK